MFGHRAMLVFAAYFFDGFFLMRSGAEAVIIGSLALSREPGGVTIANSEVENSGSRLCCDFYPLLHVNAD
jgi:hypothetical protein